MYDEEMAKRSQMDLSDSARRPSIPEQLQMKRKHHQNELVEINKAIELFDKHPELAEALTLVREIF